MADLGGEANREMKSGKAGSDGSQKKGGRPQQGRGSTSDRTENVQDQSRGSGTLGTQQHTEAGSTGTSGGQISPQPGMAARIGRSSSEKKGGSAGERRA